MNSLIKDNLKLLLLQKSSSRPRFRHVDGYKRMFCCDKCSGKFRTKDRILQHIRMYHKELKKAENWYSIVIVDGEYIDNRIKQCGTKLMVFRCDNDHVKTIPNNCFIRNCPKCETTRKVRYIKRYKPTLKFFKRISLLTLTMKGYYDLDMKKKKEFEYAAKKFWQMVKYRYRYYNFKKIRVLEVKKKAPGQYYYHFHYLTDMPWIPQPMLSDIWRKATGGESYIVDIRYVGKRWGKNQKVGYICKYLAKPFKDISNEEYAAHLYRSRFAEVRFDASSVSSLVSSSVMEENMNFLICKECGGDLYYDETVDLTGTGGENG